LVLYNDTDRLKTDLMFFDSMTESLIKALKNLDPRVERFLPGTGT